MSVFPLSFTLEGAGGASGTAHVNTCPHSPSIDMRSYRASLILSSGPLDYFPRRPDLSCATILFWLDSCRAKLLIFRHQSSLTLQYIEYTNISLEWKRDSVQISNYRILFPSKIIP